MDNLSKDERTHLNQLARDLVQGDSNISSETNEEFDQIPFIVKQVFQSDRHEEFTQYLARLIHKKEAEIQKMCGMHYQEFVQSVDQLLKVRSGSAALKDKIENMNGSIQTVGSRLIEKQRELVQLRKTLLNVEFTLEAVQTCIFVLDITNRVTVQIINKKYFSALRMIQELQSTHLKLIRDYSFCKLISTWLPEVQEAIRAAVIRDLKDWFGQIKVEAFKIGSMALSLANQRQEKAEEIINSRKDLTNSSRNNFDIATSFEMALDTKALLELEKDSSQIDFTPLFQCIHIHDILNKRIQLKLEFDENRRIQAEAILHGSIKIMKTNDISGVEQYIYDIAGFFVIEATIIATTQDFRSRSSVETLWQNATNKMNAHLYEALTECNNPELYLSIKILVHSFIKTMEIYGFATNMMTDLLVSLSEKYAEMLKNRAMTLIAKFMEEEEDYASMVIASEEDFTNLCLAESIKRSIVSNNERYPKTVPFSICIPKFVSIIRSMLADFYKFAEGFCQQGYEIDDLVKKTIENLLTEINKMFIDKLANTGISIIHQLLKNIQFFYSCCTEFEDILTDKRHSSRTMKVVLAAAKLFVETEKLAQKRLHILINAKSDNFLELIDYEWGMTQPRRHASPYLSDLLAFVSTTMESTLADLPLKVKTILYFHIFDHLALSLKKMMFNPSVPFLSRSLLETIEYDVCFLDKACVEIKTSEIKDTFVELKQLIAFGRSEQFEELLYPQIKAKKYSRVEFSDAIQLLEKMRNFDTSWFASSNTPEKHFKTMIDNALKLLRNKG